MASRSSNRAAVPEAKGALDKFKYEVEELIPEMSQGQNSNIGTLFFALGFSLMMILDVALG